MTIKEVEERTGLARSNIRFYEKEKLIEPQRNESNGYRDYSEEDVADIKKIAYLRTLGISIEDIRCVKLKQASLYEVLERQGGQLQDQIADLKKAKAMCQRMLQSEDINYEELEVEQYVDELQNYWEDNKPIFRLDSVSFLYMWGSLMTWIVITLLCLIIGVVSYAKLPLEIPVQWSRGAATSLVNKKFIFVYPAVCIAIRFLLRPYIRVKLGAHPYTDLITEYFTNYACVIALSTEVFSILFIYGILKSIVAVLFVDTFVLIGLLAVGIFKMDLNEHK